MNNFLLSQSYGWLRVARVIRCWGWLGLGCVSLAAAAQQATFNGCNSGTSYLFQGDPTDAYELNLTNGSTARKTTGGIVASTKFNALGYNTVDGYIWGATQGSSKVVRLGSDYSAQQFTVSNLPSSSYVVGDVDKNGKLYLTKGGGASSANIYVIDLTQATGSLSASTLSNTLAININDWTISPKDNNLYALSSAASANANALTLYRVSTTDGTTTVLGKVASAAGDSNPAIAADTFGAVFMDLDGTLYVSANSSGYIHSISRPDQLAASTTATITATYRATGPTSNSNDGARCANSKVATTLPVQLVSFAATAAPGRRVQLQWTTASELRNDYFEVQHATDGFTFTTVGHVAGHGSTAQASSYTFEYATPGPETTHYYRLRQVDTDGTASYSPVQAVALAAAEATRLAVAPNPAAPAELRVQVLFAGPAPVSAVLTATNLLGQPVLRQPMLLQPGTTELAPGAGLAPGAYWLRLTGDGLPTAPAVRVLLR